MSQHFPILLNKPSSVVGTAFIDITPQPPIELENSILSSFIAGQATNNKNVSQDTLATLLDLYANPTDNLSNSSLSNRASQFLTDYMMLAPERLFLKTASATQREQDVWVYSFEQPLAGAPDFFGGEHLDFGRVPRIYPHSCTAFHTSDLYYLDIGFPPVASLALQSQMQDFYISFVNDLDPGVAQWPKYDEQSPISLQLKEEKIRPIEDTLRREQTDFLSLTG
jgi:hypothetical protein